jgi:hypothetical protein
MKMKHAKRENLAYGLQEVQLVSLRRLEAPPPLAKRCNHKQFDQGSDKALQRAYFLDSFEHAKVQQQSHTEHHKAGEIRQFPLLQHSALHKVLQRQLL